MHQQNQPTMPEVTSGCKSVDIISSNSIYREQLRQAKASFNLAFGLTAISAIISCITAVLIVSGNVSAGAVMTRAAATSVTVSASCLKFAKNANDKLDKIPTKSTK
ncbi:MAG: hypothetical protein F6K47_11750 [Symploca sp. SIO2E6]|nr:hypothetical protein [Symploca sp. SIO2E6]